MGDSAISIQTDGYSYSVFSNWSFLIRDIANNVIVTPRYVGTTSREDPRKRRTHHNRATSLAEKFDAKLSQLFPALSSKRIVYLIKDSALFYADVRLAAQNDLYEGWMISFFGSSSLLNRQRGGINPSFIPSHEDVCTFLKCRTTLLTKLEGMSFCKENGLAEEVRSLYRPFEELIYGIARKTKHRHDIRGYVDQISQQATPARMMLEVLATWENKTFQIHFKDLQPILSFNNLYHWTGSEIINDGTSIDLFHQWRQVVQPLIIVTYGKEVVRVINKKASNARIDNLIRAAGRAQILDKDSPKEAILIPLLHPGFNRRSQQSPLQRRVFLLTYMAVWVYMDAALELVQGTCGNYWIRHELCQLIMEIAERKLWEANFHNALNSASEQLLAETTKAHPVSHKSEDRSDSCISSNMLRPFQTGIKDISDEVEVHFLNCASHMRVFFEGVADSLRTAQGEPHSRERQRQIKSLYSQKVPGLVTYLDIADQEKWSGFLETQPKDCSLVACVEALEPLARMPLAKVELLQRYGCNAMGNFDSRRTALSAICADFLSCQIEWTKWMKRRGPDKPLLDVEDRQLRKFPVHVSLSGTLTIGGEVVGIPKAVRIKSKAIATKTWLDKRTAEFDLERITIRDGNGNPLHSVRRFLCESEDLKALWDYILGTTDVVAPQESVTIMPANNTQRLVSQDAGPSVGAYGIGVKTKSNQKPGKPPLKQHQKGSSCQNSPPHENDALWLLNKFVNERFPEGGMFSTGDPTVFVKSSGDYQAFQAFLKQPEHIVHPWSEEWLDIPSKPNALITLSTSLKWLREVQVSVQNAPMSMPRGGRAFRARCSVYKLGPRQDGW
ncbi:hypothetical protein K469DRAFT_744879 [Zopfia rhizophila CBS 207.26]|uniref:Uncharacterized protein n=1 Tax=Zopfia rhizophila CBS 207.26 TaxID=1314779 RepID=A0A6A6EPU3_9PEZI|nr:hypothetical protein K469DRAFT_744879 [Zopfia rhizophila CBS 207.26]